jgi:DNA-binding ferritin-like protein
MNPINIYLRAIAQASMDEESTNLLSIYLAFTRAMYITHQQNHWLAKNYNDHLLFQRLYEETVELVDGTAERVVGLCQVDSFKEFQSIASKFNPKEISMVGLLSSSLEIERAFQKLSKKVYDTLKEKDMLTLGLDDLLMSQASTGESHIYLLQQAISEYKNGPVENAV